MKATSIPSTAGALHRPQPDFSKLITHGNSNNASSTAAGVASKVGTPQSPMQLNRAWLEKRAAKQGAEAVVAEPNKIRASTPFDFEGKNLTATVCCGRRQWRFQQLVEETLTVKRATRSMSMYQFVLSMVLAVYDGFSRLHHLRFLEPMLTGILRVLRLPQQCACWPFLELLNLGAARQLLVEHLETPVGSDGKQRWRREARLREEPVRRPGCLPAS
jgi:hypothetical protein